MRHSNVCIQNENNMLVLTGPRGRSSSLKRGVKLPKNCDSVGISIKSEYFNCSKYKITHKICKIIALEQFTLKFFTLPSQTRKIKIYYRRIG